MKALSSEGLKAMFHQLDINDLDSIKTAAAYFKGKYGGVDILINNAGIAFKGIYIYIDFNCIVHYSLIHRKFTYNV